MSARKPSLLLLAATIMAISLPALADHDDYDDDDYHHYRYSQEHRARRSHQPSRYRQAGYISSTRAANIAARHTRARVTDVDLTTWRGRRVYEVDLDGRRGDYEVIVDARSGRILSSKFDPDD